MDPDVDSGRGEDRVRSGGDWAWSSSLPEFVLRRGWRAKAYRNGRVEGTWYNVSLFDIPAEFWTEGVDESTREKDRGSDTTENVVLERTDSEARGESQVLEGEEEEEYSDKTAAEREQRAASQAKASTLCSKCKVQVEPQDRLQHYQSSWHLFNLRRSLASGGRKPPVSRGEYDALSSQDGTERGKEDVAAPNGGHGGASEEEEGSGDDEGDAGVPDSQTESAQITVARGRAYVFTLWSVLLTSDPRRASNASLFSALRGLGQQIEGDTASTDPGSAPASVWVVLMLRSGRFAGAVFEGPKPVVHKVFRRYTVRKKAGGSQSAHDNKGRRAQSAGASLRRYNEQATREDVAKILEAWGPQIARARLIFLSVPKTMRGVLLGPQEPLIDKDDPRVRYVPFMTEEPTFAEVQSVHAKLMTAKFAPPTTNSNGRHAGIAPQASTRSHISTDTDGTNQGTDNHSSSAPLPSEASMDDDSGSGPCGVRFRDASGLFKDESEGAVGAQKGNSELYEACVAGDTARVKELLSVMIRSDDDVREADDTPPALPSPPTAAMLNGNNEDDRTPLHAAAEKGDEEMIEALLIAGADPCALDCRERPPYFLCGTKAARDAFRRHKGREPDRWDWDRAAVPEALTSEMERKKRDKARGKKKRAKSKKKAEKERDTAQVQHAAQAEVEGDDDGDEDDEEADDGRQRCDACGKPIRVMYTRLQFLYCSTACVQDHKRTLMAEAAMKRMGMAAPGTGGGGR